jgi:O-antigen/teichoic acid export membrane protein
MSLRASVAYILTRAVAGALAMASLALFVRVLGPTEYAHLSLGLAAAALSSSLLIIPLNTTLGRLYGEAALRERLIATLTLIVMGLGIVLLIAALVLEWQGASWLARGVLPAAALFAALQGLLDFVAQWSTSALQPRRYSRLLLVRALGVLLFGFLALQSSPSAPAVLLAMALSCALSLAISLRGSGWPALKNYDASLQPRMLRFAAPLLLTCALSYLLQWGDRYLLARMVPLAELGRYSALADFTQQTLILVCSGLGSAWYPRIVQAWGAQNKPEAQRLMSRYALVALALILPAATGFAVLLVPLAAVLFGAAYLDVPAGLSACLVLAAIIGAAKSFYFDIPLLLAERVWRQALGIALSALLALLVMWLAVPQLGITGAALGLLCGQGAGVIYSVVAGRGVLHAQPDLRAAGKLLLATLVMLALLLSLPHETIFTLALSIVLAGASYAAMLLVLDVDGLRSQWLRSWLAAHRGRRR